MNGDPNARLDLSDYPKPPGFERTCGECDRWGWIAHNTGFCWSLKGDKAVVHIASEAACGDFKKRWTRRPGKGIEVSE